jgi:pimeloyl-ACP methyl ester carboxylesterase
MFDGHAKWLNQLGYAVLALDFRGHGGSGAADRTFGWREAEDAAAALVWIREDQPRRKVGVIGVSLGGAAALLGRKGPLPVNAMVLQGVYPDIRTAILNRLNRAGIPLVAAVSEPLLSYQSYLRYGVAPESIAPRDGLRRFQGSVLVIGGTRDRDTTPADTQVLFTAAPGPKSLWMVDANHVEVSKLESRPYRERVRRFFKDTLGS